MRHFGIVQCRFLWSGAEQAPQGLVRGPARAPGALGQHSEGQSGIVGVPVLEQGLDSLTPRLLQTQDIPSPFY